MPLSESQKAVVDQRGGDLQVIACAGSGKTESISQRIADLIAGGAEPGSIVAFTFTERAATELRNRIVQRVGERMGPDFLDRLGRLFVGTIHGYCFHLLQDHVPRYGNYDVLDEHRHAGLLSREHRNLGLSKLGQKHWSPIRDFARNVDVIGNELIPPAILDGTPIGECYAAYRAMLDRYHFLTFSLLISCAVDALDDPAIFAKVHGPLRYLFVDEYQDINPAQERLIELLSQAPVELCVVGDDDQAIYQWRGSEVRHILEFAQRRHGATKITLAENRRSRPSIVAKAADFAELIPARLAKKMQSVRAAGVNEIVPFAAETDEDEAETIARTIERLHADGHAYRDIAVLYRSVRTSAPPLIEALEARGIPYSCAGRTGLFMEPEIALMGQTFVWLADGEWKSERFSQTVPVALDTLAAGFERHFGGGKPIPTLRAYLEDWKSFVLGGARAISLVGDFYKLLAVLRAHGTDVDTPAGSTRFGAFARFSQILADFEHVTRRGRYVEEEGVRQFRGGRDRGKPYLQSLANYIVHYALDAYEEFEGEEATGLDAVDIITVHQAKGLEWSIVFLPALVQGRFPARRAGREQDWLLPERAFPAASRRRYEGGDGEERRLFYVALTRARDCVYLSCFERKTNRFQPSPYLTEIAGAGLPLLNDLPLPGKPDAQKKSEPPALEVSFSDLALYDECGHRYRLGAVFGFQQELAVELGYGKAIHHVLRQLAETSRAKGVVPESDELRAIVNGEFYLPFANAPAFDRMLKSAARLVDTYVSEYAEDLGRVWATERPFQLHLVDGVISGRADVILDQEGGQIGSLAIVDYKVATDPVRDERYRLQLAVYAAAGRGEGLDVKAAYLHELKDGSRHGVDVGGPAATAAIRSVARSVGAIRAGRLEAAPEPEKCGACDFRRICGFRADRDEV